VVEEDGGEEKDVRDADVASGWRKGGKQGCACHDSVRVPIVAARGAPTSKRGERTVLTSTEEGEEEEEERKTMKGRVDLDAGEAKDLLLGEVISLSFRPHIRLRRLEERVVPDRRLPLGRLRR
jgi:hypothetical protein